MLRLRQKDNTRYWFLQYQGNNFIEQNPKNIFSLENGRKSLNLRK